MRRRILLFFTKMAVTFILQPGILLIFVWVQSNENDSNSQVGKNPNTKQPQKT